MGQINAGLNRTQGGDKCCAKVGPKEITGGPIPCESMLGVKWVRFIDCYYGSFWNGKVLSCGEEIEVQYWNSGQKYKFSASEPCVHKDGLKLEKVNKASALVRLPGIGQDRDCHTLIRK